MPRTVLLGLSLALLAATASGQAPLILSPADLSPGARFGASLSISGCGHPPDPVVLAVGAPHGRYGEPAQAAGEAYVYLGPGQQEAQRLQSPDPSPGDLFGYSTYANCGEFRGYLVGAPGIGAAYHFHNPSFTVTELDGSAAGAGAGFGYATTALGAYLTVGAPFAAGGGMVLVFPEYDGASAPPSASPRLTLSPTHYGDGRFGAALAAGEANTGYVIAVGAPGDGTQPGAVYIYRTTGDGGLGDGIRLEGPPLFGTQVALPSSVGPRPLAVTVPEQGGGEGGVYLFAESQGAWVPTDTLHAGLEEPLNFGRALWQGYPGLMLVGSPRDPQESPQPLLAARYHTDPNTTGWVDVAVPERSGEFGWAVGATPFGQTWAIGDPSAGGVGAVAVGTADLFPAPPPVSAEPGAEPRRLRISSIAPNPARSTAEVALELGAAGPVRVSVIDLLGREMTTAFRGALPQGKHSLSVDVSAFPPGTYVLYARSAAATTTELFVVVR